MTHRLTECRDCKATVSREALTCPHCGCPWPDGRPVDLKPAPVITIDRLAAGVCLGVLLASAVSLGLYFLFGLILGFPW